ncbi:MAG: NAD(P)-dependent glycerol-1-phosphate dehydrogenase [Desulfurococcales archaeon]|nr:NAD(P)-dependent glycerol-1-phosphate dehydrogenase [Desulfurococcales archaeon]
MKNTGIHIIDLPRRVVVGSNIIGKIGDYARSLFPDAEKIAVITGKIVGRKIYPLVEESMREKGFEIDKVTVQDASTITAEKLIDELGEIAPDIVVGLGGGRSIDLAKYSAHILKLRWISIPTVASHDGIASPFVSLKGFEKPISKKARMPELIYIDVEIVRKAPKRNNIAGFGDLIGKFTSVRDWKLAHKLKGEYYGEYAASLALLSAKHVSISYREISLGTSEGYRVLLEALVSSGVAMGIAGSTRPASGSEHLFAHALSMISKNPPLHGEAVAVGTIMMAYLHGIKWKRIRHVLRTVGAPVTAEELGVADTDIIEALVMAAKIRPERYTILGETGLTYEAAEKLARKTGVIT